jgi:flagellin-like hook-associated protein FlgL
MDEVVSIGNTSIGTSYIFGGYNYTGSTDGVSTTAPFSVDKTTGDLIYNGINLSQLAWTDEFSANTDLMTDDAASILDLATQLGGSLTDVNALGIATEALNGAGSLISAGEAALHASEAFGVSTGSGEYTALADFVGDFSDLYHALELECSKPLAGDYILESDAGIQLTDEGEIDYEYYAANDITVMTDDEFANCYSTADCQTIANDMAALLAEQFDAGGNPIGSQMEQATAPLAGVVTISADVQSALDAERTNRTFLQIGSDQEVEISFTGLDVMGQGKDNIYHLMGKCVAMLEGDLDADGLSQMVSELQDAQSEVLGFETRIGSTENRLNLISSRYGTSEINYTEMKSEAEDVDMAEAITNLTTAQTVYSAALAAGAELIQTSLIDFLN